MSATRAMLRSEVVLVTRDLGNLIFGLFFPAVLLLVLGVLPGFADADPELGGRSLIEIYTPITLVLTFAMVGVGSLSGGLATYRTQGVLRRLRVTPVGPTRLLAAQFGAHLLLALAGSALAVLAAVTVYDVGGPRSWLGFVLALALAAAALFAFGLVIGALASTPSAANGMAPLVWIPLMVLGGLWFPREAMPDTMRTISDYSPAGAAVDAVNEAWFSGEVRLANLAVLLVTVVVVGAITVRVFRWE